MIFRSFKGKGKQIDYKPIDIGLPSGTLWCDRNVGAQNEHDAGSYFRWADPNERKEYCEFDMHDVDKDVLITLNNDMAFQNMRGVWQMPTKDDIMELFKYCKIEDKTLTFGKKHVRGHLLTGVNYNQLFLPRAGYKDRSTVFALNGYGDYWLKDKQEMYTYASIGENVTPLNYRTYCGMTVRAVIKP